jgi:hypothetical protein
LLESHSDEFFHAAILLIDEGELHAVFGIVFRNKYVVFALINPFANGVAHEPSQSL